MKLVNFPAEPTDYERWKDAARGQRVSFAEWARRALNERVGTGGLTKDDWHEARMQAEARVVTTSEVGPQPDLKKAGRASACEHRLPKGTFCKKCGTVKP